MYALTVTQPYAWLICSAPPALRKRIENRMWQTTYRGPLLIHASARMTTSDWEAGQDMLLDAQAGEEYIWLLPPRELLPLGGIVGIVNLTDIRRTDPDNLRPYETRGGFGWHLEDARELPFVACPGRLKLWTVPDEVMVQLPAGLA